MTPRWQTLTAERLKKVSFYFSQLRLSKTTEKINGFSWPLIVFLSINCLSYNSTSLCYRVKAAHHQPQRRCCFQAAVFHRLVFDTREAISGEGMLTGVCYPHSSNVKTSKNSHCVDFVLLNVWLTHAYIAQSWCINVISPYIFLTKEHSCRSGVLVHDLSESSAYVLVI